MSADQNMNVNSKSFNIKHKFQEEVKIKPVRPTIQRSGRLVLFVPVKMGGAQNDSKVMRMQESGGKGLCAQQKQNGHPATEPE